MIDLKTKREAYQQMARDLVEASKGEDEVKFTEAFAAFAQGIEKQVMREAEALRDEHDVTVLAQRGVRQLTSEEKGYYQKVIEAMRAPNPQQALGNLDVVMPETVIDDVFTDLETNHPLLEMIDFQYGRGVTTWLMNTNENQLATWSPLCAKIVEELTSGFKSISVTQCKLSAFLPICKAMLDLGPVWLDRYVRAVLREALALGLEDGILNGGGVTANLFEPIGMRKNLAGAVDPATGYPDKTPVVVTSFDPVSYGSILSTLATTDKGNPRAVDGVILVVSWADYFTKVMPATTYFTPQGTYVNNILPYPTKIIPSILLDEGEAIIGVAGRYLFVTGSGKDGMTIYSDDYRFLEDERVYLIKLYGYGQPKDNNSFVLLDISGLQPIFQRVQVVGSEDIAEG